MGSKGAAMRLAPEKMGKDVPRQQRSSQAKKGAQPVEPIIAAHKENAHVSSESLLKAGGTVVGAAFLGGAIGGTVGAVTGAVAGLAVSIYTSVSDNKKEGVRCS